MRTVVWGIEDIQSNINSQLKNKASYFEWFFFTLDESMLLSCIHIWEGSAEFEMTEELASVIAGIEQTGENIFKQVEEISIMTWSRIF